jgi:hypothetical protein
MREGKRGPVKTETWRPDTRVSLGLAVAAALLVAVGFAALFASADIRFLPPAAVIRERLVFSAPAPRRLPPRVPRRPMPALSRPAPISLRDQLWPSLQPPISLPVASSAEDYLKERAQQGAAALRDKVTGGQLTRNLGKVTEMPALRDNQSIPTTAGDSMVRSGDSCAQVHTVQGSPSPTNKINLAEPMATCPGSPKQDMGKALEDWAKRLHDTQPPPP